MSKSKDMAGLVCARGPGMLPGLFKEIRECNLNIFARPLDDDDAMVREVLKSIVLHYVYTKKGSAHWCITCMYYRTMLISHVVGTRGDPCDDKDCPVDGCIEAQAMYEEGRAVLREHIRKTSHSE